MASQFTGTDKANLLSTALTSDSGDNIAITATSDSEVQGLAKDDTVVLGTAVTTFTVSGGDGNDSLSISLWYNASAQIFIVSSRETLVNKLLTSKEHIKVLVGLSSKFWINLAKVNESEM